MFDIDVSWLVLVLIIQSDSISPSLLSSVSSSAIDLEVPLIKDQPVF